MANGRLSSGVGGLDELIGGGFLEGSNILVTGDPGTGKSILGLQFISNGAANGERGIYLTVEEEENKLASQAKQFGWDLEGLEKEKKVVVNVIEEFDIEEILDQLEKEVKDIKAKRLVVDSLSMMSIFTRVMDPVSKGKKKTNLLHPGGYELTRSQVVGILKRLSELGTTNLIISEGQEISDKIAQFAADGVVGLGINEAIGTRSLTIVKMRETKHPLGKMNTQIGDKGLEIIAKK